MGKLSRVYLTVRNLNKVGEQTLIVWNQAFFTKLFVGPEGIKGAELTEESAPCSART